MKKVLILSAVLICALLATSIAADLVMTPAGSTKVPDGFKGRVNAFLQFMRGGNGITGAAVAGSDPVTETHTFNPAGAGLDPTLRIDITGQKIMDPGATTELEIVNSVSGATGSAWSTGPTTVFLPSGIDILPTMYSLLDLQEPHPWWGSYTWSDSGAIIPPLTPPNVAVASIEPVLGGHLVKLTDYFWMNAASGVNAYQTWTIGPIGASAAGTYDIIVTHDSTGPWQGYTTPANPFSFIPFSSGPLAFTIEVKSACMPVTGNSCVDNLCCVTNACGGDFKNRGDYVSCVAEARGICGAIPSSDATTIQRDAALVDIDFKC